MVEELGIPKQVLCSRLDWFCEDNYGRKTGLTYLREETKNKNLNDYVYFDEIKRLEDSIEYRLIKFRIYNGVNKFDVAERLGLTVVKVSKYMRRFRRANKLEDKFVYQIRKDIRDKGLENFLFPNIK